MTSVANGMTRATRPFVITPPAVAAHATDRLCVSSVTLEEQIGGWSALARSARTALEHEHAAMFLAAGIAKRSNASPSGKFRSLITSISNNTVSLC